MMSAYEFTVSPSISPNVLSGWNMFNTWMQRALEQSIHFEQYDSFESQRQAIINDKVDLIYANPFDASLLAREKGFLPVATVNNQRDEAIIAVPKQSGITAINDLKPGVRIRSTDAPHVKTMGMIMLESAGLSFENVNYENRDTYVVVAKELLRNEADVGIFLADSYAEFSPIITEQLNVLVSSDIQLIRHALMISPKLAELQEPMRKALTSNELSPVAQSAMETLKFDRWQIFNQEAVEFMIDLISTLTE